MAFTEEQLRAINSRDKNLLLSAAAGSGKTTVLVERIIGRILDENNPLDIDRLLVCTFTKAAAAQMKDKIRKAIDKKRSEDPTNKHLIRQAAFLPNAQITTIHGFCLNVIKNHFQEISLNPDFRIGDDGECKLLKQDVLKRVIEESYEEGRDDFINMTEAIARARDDRELEKIILKLYEFSMSDPNPEEWLNKCLMVYEQVSVDNFQDTKYIEFLLRRVHLELMLARDDSDAAMELTNEPGGPAAYYPMLEADRDIIDTLLDCNDYDEFREELAKVSFGRLATIKASDNVDAELKDKVKALRDNYKGVINDFAKKEFFLSSFEHVEMMKKCGKTVRELVTITLRFMDVFKTVKREKNILDFSDLEHLCIEILSKEDGITAGEYREFFEEIYVDEYQDSNFVQEEMLKLICRDNNLFMVGDVKQSIYSFRLARPELFMNKYLHFSTGDGDNIKIDLHHNFRSRKSVLDTVNQLFFQIMSKDMGGIEYDSAAALYPKSEYPPVADKYEKSELMLITKSEEINSKELEARIIAHRIKRLFKEGQPVYDSDLKATRDIRYSDIVILLRASKGYDEILRRVLTEEGIPVDVVSSVGYFAAMEVAVLLDYLRILDNPLQDIPLASCLKSSFGNFSNKELALLRSYKKKMTLYDALVSVCDASDDNYGEFSCEMQEVINKSRLFLSNLENIRKRVSYTPIYDIILEIIEGEYGKIILSSVNGRKKMANLNMLLNKAYDFGRTSYKGLFHFIRYIEVLKKYDVDYGEANLVDGVDDSVRIMTIHKSKGLEFPVCFIAGMNKKYNQRDSIDTVVTDIDLGLGLDLVDIEKRTKNRTLIKGIIADKRSLDVCAEEQRILYVAMTRAKEKLIMSGVVDDSEKFFDGNSKPVIKCTSYLSLVQHGLLNGGIPSLDICTYSDGILVGSEVREQISLEEKKLVLENILKNKDIIQVNEELKKRFEYEYQYKNEMALFEKVSVTELKKRSHSEIQTDSEVPDMTKELFAEETEEYIPSFMREEGKDTIAANLHGTAVHRVYELWDYNLPEDEFTVKAFIDGVVADGRLEANLANSVGTQEICGFLQSDIAGRMKNAFFENKLYREQPFVFNTENMLVQGIIDAYFIEDNKIVIVDYKTDRVKKPEELIDRYHVQLEYYAKALSTMLNLDVKEAVIYSTRHKRSVNIPMPVIHC